MLAFKKFLILGALMFQQSVIATKNTIALERSQIEIGAIYEHYKGKRYKILDVVFNADNCELAVVYESLYDDADFGSHAHWVRSLTEFTGTLVVDGKEQQRFKKVTQ